MENSFLISQYKNHKQVFQIISAYKRLQFYKLILIALKSHHEIQLTTIQLTS